MIGKENLMENIPVLLLFVITMAANLLGGLTRTYYSKHISQSMQGYHLFNAVSSLVCGVVLLLLSGGNFALSSYTLLMAILFGIITAVQQITNSAALSTGPWSYTSVIISMSTVITALSGVLFFDESIRVTQLFGIALMLVCLVLSVKPESGEQKKKSLRWFLWCLASCICSGGVGIMQKIHQNSDHRGELTMFLVIAFIGSFIFSAGNMIVGKARNGKSEKEPLFSAKASILLLTVLFCAGGVGVALNNLINLYLSGVVESAIFFPIVNGGGLILITIASLVFFREKLTGRQWIGMAFGLTAVLLLCL